MVKKPEGYTFVELLIVVTILLILASAVLPLAQVTSQRTREAELRRNLREMRTASPTTKAIRPISTSSSRASRKPATRAARSSNSCGGFRPTR